jgi:hypothetical protein
MLEAFMSTITVRTPDDTLAETLRKKAKCTGQSVNKLIIAALEDHFAPSGRARRRFTDLDHLAGTWTQADLDDFVQATAGLDRVDPDDWR